MRVFKLALVLRLAIGQTYSDCFRSIIMSTLRRHNKIVVVVVVVVVIVLARFISQLVYVSL